ncbi:MAG: EamA family transporter [Candidatus Rokuibacteriota bacterium]
MTGVLWAAASGIGFGLFQSVNVRAVRKLDDVYVSTFLQLLVAAAVLLLVCALAGDLPLIADASAWAIASFAIAGALHFFLGWTLLNISQDRIGAARTGPLLTTTPLFGIAIAAVALGQVPSAAAFGGIAVIVAGAVILSAPGAGSDLRRQDSIFALGCAFLWALSPIFTLEGLEEIDSPLLGVTIGIVFSSLAFAFVAVLSAGDRRSARSLPREGVALKVVAGALVALATWGRWAALDLATVGVVLALSLLAVPTVLLLAPLVSGRHLERVDARVLGGAALVVAGSLVLIAVE